MSGKQNKKKQSKPKPQPSKGIVKAKPRNQLSQEQLNRLKSAGNRRIRIGNTLVGYGDYTEAKGRALYDKKKQKKKARKEGGKGWWDTLSDAAANALPVLAPMAIKALTGFGDYTVDSNVVAAQATDGALGGQIPIIENSHCANIVRHREYIGPIMGSLDEFQVVKLLDLNPGLVDTFPWLSPVANCYTRWRARGIIIEYVPLASDYTTAGSLGFVAIGTQYNPLDPIFTDKRSMLNHEFSCESKPSKTLVHPIECAKNQMAIDEYFIRSGPMPPNSDQRFYDLGKVTVAVGGNPVDTQIGELWMSYEMEFYQPKMALENGDPCFLMSFTGTNSATYGATPAERSCTGNMKGIKVEPTTITFPPNISYGFFMMMYTRTGTVANPVIIADPFLDLVNATLFGYWLGSPNGLASLNNCFMTTIIFKVTGPGCTVSIPTGYQLPEGPSAMILNRLPGDAYAPLTPLTVRPRLVSTEKEDSEDDERVEDLENTISELKEKVDQLISYINKSEKLGLLEKLGKDAPLKF